jgi:hypothetical protein
MEEERERRKRGQWGGFRVGGRKEKAFHLL